MSIFSNIYNKYKLLIHYSIFGTLAFFINIGIKWLLLFTLLNANDWLDLQLAIVLSWFAAVIFSYFTNRKYVFKSTNVEKLKEFFNFIFARLITLFIEMFIMWFFVTFLKLNSHIYVIIFTFISQFLVVVGNYIFSKLFVFKKGG